MADFPQSPDAIDATWLSSVLGKTVSEFTIAPLGEGVGILGLVTRVTMTTPEGTETLIAKFQSPVEGNRDIANLYSMYQREYIFYTEIAPTLSVRSPACYYAAYDEKTSAFVLLLEDLTGYRIGDQITGCSESETVAVISSLAALHAATWMTEDFAPIERHNTENQIAGMQAGLAAGWPVIAEQFSSIIPEGLDAKIELLTGQIPQLLEGITRDPICINHGDLRLDNIFFGDSHVALVDFQAICRSAPEHDLAYFLTQSLSQSLRNKRDWVADYHAALTQHGIDYPLATCRARFQACALYFLCYAVVIASALDLANDRGQRLAETILTNCFSALVDLDALSLID